MRLWSLHPKYLDRLGLLGLWREGLLALKTLQTKQSSYFNHPQLLRFKKEIWGIESLRNYLYFIYEEGVRRKYNFDSKKIGLDHDDWVVDYPNDHLFIQVTKGQLEYEFNHLQKKLVVRDKNKFFENSICIELKGGTSRGEISDLLVPNPIFLITDGDIEPWEKVKNET